MFKVPERYRVKLGQLKSDESDGNNGVFIVKHPQMERALRTIASDGMGWEHVSVSLPNRTPTWPEMCFIKDMFWESIDMVVQFHPPKKEYVNCHPYCLHLWRKANNNKFCKKPPSVLVGPKK